jgi:predicted ATPase/class 3 adenylate cyclase
MAARTEGVRAFVFTDLVASTEFFAALGEDAAGKERRAHFERVAAAAAAYNGEVVKTIGDAVMMVFASPADAVDCAVRIQQTEDRERSRQAGLPPVRIGVNAGEASCENDDWFGEPVIVASRLCARAEPNSILVGDVVRLLAGPRLAETMKPVGLLELKGLATPVPAAEVRWEPISAWVGDLPPSLASTQSVPCVGRIPERDKLREAWDSAAAGHPSVVLLAGEPGIGKTRLAADFALAVHSSGAAVLHGRCDEDLLRPYQPFVEILEQLARAAGEDLGVIAAEAQIDLSVLARLSPLFGGPSADPPGETERFILYDTYGRLLTALAGRVPVLLVVDDLHWADRPTLLLLRHVMRAVAGRPLLLLGTYRDTDVDRHRPLSESLAEMRREAGFTRIRLGGLEATEVVELLEARAEHELSDRGLALAEALHERTEGNPLFVWETLRHLIESGELEQGEDGRWESRAASVDDLGIPEGVREAIGRRLSALTDETNQVLAAAAVLGPTAELPVLRRMVDLDEDRLVDSLEEAVRASVVSEALDGGELSYVFTHALVRHTLYDEISLARRQRLHRRAADAIEAAHGSDLAGQSASLARHCQAAGAAVEADRTAQWLVAAGQRAVAALAWEEASTHFEAALEIADETSFGPLQKAQLLRALGDINYVSGGGRSAEYLSRALEMFERAGADEQAAQMHSRLCRDLSSDLFHRDMDRARAHFEAAEPVMRSGPERTARGHWLVGGATLAFMEAQPLVGIDLANEAMELASRLDRPPLEANARILRGFMRRMVGEFAAGDADMLAGRQAAEKANASWVAYLGSRLLIMSWWLTDPIRAIETASAELAAPRLAQAPLAQWTLRSLMVNTMAVAGRTAEARQEAVLYPAPAKNLPPWDQIYLFEGQWERFTQPAEEDRFGFAPHGRYLEFFFHQQSVAFDALRLDHELADLATEMQTAAERAGALGISAGSWRPLGALALARLGDADSAEAMLAPAAEVLKDEGATGFLIQFHRAAGWIARSRGDEEEAAAAFGRALAGARSRQVVVFEGLVLRDLGQRREAAEVFRSAGYGEPWMEVAQSG